MDKLEKDLVRLTCSCLNPDCSVDLYMDEWKFCFIEAHKHERSLWRRIKEAVHYIVQGYWQRDEFIVRGDDFHPIAKFFREADRLYNEEDISE